MIVGLPVLLLLVILFVLSRNEKGSLFERAAVYLHKRKIVEGLLQKNSAFVGAEIKKMHPGEAVDYHKTKYETEKIKLLLLILFLGGLFCCAYSAKLYSERNLKADGLIRKGAVGEADKEILLIYQGMKGKDSIQLSIPARVYGFDEIENLLPDFWSELEEKILAGNASFFEVVHPLSLVSEIKGYPFDVEYVIENPLVLGPDGELYEEGETTLYVSATYETYGFEKSWNIVVLPEAFSKEEKRRKKVLDACKERLAQTRTEEELMLPLVVDGEEIFWKEDIKDYSPLFMCVVLALMVVVYFLYDQDLAKKRMERQEKMREEYPTVVQKFTLYYGAGMTIRASISKLAYDIAGKKEGTANPIYEELLYGVYRLQAGKSEAGVYEELGNRIGLKEYTRFFTLLIQNLKKGNSAFLERLHQECREAVNESKNQKKKKGEEAENKLLLPMVMMFAVIMIMIMYPALSSMGL